MNAIPVWEWFEKVCAIGHPSGEEAALARFLAEEAGKAGLAVTTDAAGNLRIDRAPAPGHEGDRGIILQAHLDMVPQAAAGVDFDFVRNPIRTEIRDGWMTSAAGTTLGADNGIGVAAAMALLLDPALVCGPVAALFTVSEEVGLDGALALTPAMLKGDYLLNLDTEEEGEFYIGCAGGARLELEYAVEKEAAPVGLTGLRCEVRGLAGGHSGINIADRRGNAVKFLARLLQKLPEFRIASLAGGTLDNVIPREAAAAGAILAGMLPELQERADRFAAELKREFNAPAGFGIDLVPIPRPETVWKWDFQEGITEELATAPDGPLGFDDTLNVVRVSCNLAAVKSDAERLVIRTSQRALADAEREATTRLAIAHFNTKFRVDCAYPGWTPRPESPLLARSQAVYRELFGKEAAVKVIHAGLECGILSGIRPELEFLSLGPSIRDPHSPSERVEVASVERLWNYLQSLIPALGRG